MLCADHISRKLLETQQSAANLYKQRLRKNSDS
jgi:predicted ATPase